MTWRSSPFKPTPPASPWRWKARPVRATLRTRASASTTLRITVRIPAKIEQFARYEEEETRHIAGLLDKLQSTSDGDASLLDRTLVFWCSNIGNPSAHASNNLPVFIAGGGLKHQGHLAFDHADNKPLSNLYLRMLRQMGIDEQDLRQQHRRAGGARLKPHETGSHFIAAAILCGLAAAAELPPAIHAHRLKRIASTATTTPSARPSSHSRK